MEYIILPDLDLLINWSEGVCTLEEIRLSILNYQQDPAFHRQIKVLSDFRRSTIDLKTGDVEDFLSKHSNSQHSLNKTAALVSGTTDTAVTMLYQKRISVQPVEIFQTVEKACEWLDVPQKRIIKHIPASID